MATLSANVRTAGWILAIAVATAFGLFAPLSEYTWFTPLKAAIFILVVAAVSGILLPGFLQAARGSAERSGGTQEDAEPIHEIPAGKTWEGFARAFNLFHRKYACLVRTSTASSSVVFYFRKDRSLKLEYGEDAAGVIDTHMVSAENGLLAQVLAGKTPMLQNALPSGFSFSGRPGTEIRSFLGSPVFLRDEPVGVVAVGSGAPDDFGEADLALAVQVADLLADVMAAYRQGLQEEIDGKVFKLHLDFLRQLRDAETEDEAVTAFVHCLAKLFSFDRFTLNHKAGAEGTIQFVHGQLDGLNQGVRFPLDEGLTGWVLKRNTPLVIGDIGEGDYLRPRYFKGENIKHGLLSFVGIPLGQAEGAWGCFTLEHKRPGLYGDKAKDVLLQFGAQLELGLEKIRIARSIKTVKPGDSPLPRFELE